MPFNLTREQLYDLVWTVPRKVLSEKIGISDVAIAKQCRRFGIPVPERGYWARLQAGKRVTKATLAERDLGTINLISMSGKLTDELRALIKGEPGVADAQDDNIDLLTERFRKRLGKVTVPRDFSRVHPAIAALLEQDEKRRQEYAKHSYSWYQPRYDTPFEQRRLRFLNGLFLGLAKVGGTGSVSGVDAQQELSMRIGGNSVGFKLEKMSSRRKGSSATAAKTAERLCLTLTHHDIPNDIKARWEDDDGNKLERHLTEIIVGMAVAGERLHRCWLEKMAAWDRQRREQEQREAIRRKREAEEREQARLAAIEKAKIDALVGEAEAWRNAHNIREYVNAVRTAAEIEAFENELEYWCEWALAEADKIDPIVSRRCAVLGPHKASDDQRSLNSFPSDDCRP